MNPSYTKHKCYLCVDDFIIKYHSKEDTNNLLSSLKKDYDITVDCIGNIYCGLKLEWDYNNEYIDISMSGYVAE